MEWRIYLPIDNNTVIVRINKPLRQYGSRYCCLQIFKTTITTRRWWWRYTRDMRYCTAIVQLNIFRFNATQFHAPPFPCTTLRNVCRHVSTRDIEWSYVHRIHVRTIHRFLHRVRNSLALICYRASSFLMRHNTPLRIRDSTACNGLISQLPIRPLSNTKRRIDYRMKRIPNRLQCNLDYPGISWLRYFSMKQWKMRAGLRIRVVF